MKKSNKKLIRWEDLQLEKTIQCSLNGVKAAVTLFTETNRKGITDFVVEVCYENSDGIDRVDVFKSVEANIFNALHLKAIN